MKITGIERHGGNAVPVYDISHGFDCSHWGLTDLYEESEKDLRELYSSGFDFRTEWCSSKKELESARYSRLNGKPFVEVTKYMDDIYEDGYLFVDALDDLYGTDAPELSDEDCDEIRRLVDYSGIYDSTTNSLWVDADATYDDIMAAVAECVEYCDDQLNDWYEQFKGLVAGYVGLKNLHK